MSFLSYFRQVTFKSEIIDEVFFYFLTWGFNINEKGKVNEFLMERISAKLYAENDSIKQELDFLMKHFDIGVSGINVAKNLDDEYQVYIEHDTENSKEKLVLEYESKGTRALFYLLPLIRLAIDTGSPAIIDELETGLHPEAVNKLISYFIAENEESNAQLIFSSHSFEFLNRLDRNQIYLVEKDKYCNSEAYRLDSVEESRPDENKLKKYRSGAYGASPKIRI